MGSKYFGRALKKWRLFAGISQEELAQRAQVSVTLVGTVERERGHLSEEIFCKLCLGLESKLGRPMLRTLFADGVTNLWQEVSAAQAVLRQERGLEPEEPEPFDINQREVEQAIDSVLAAVKQAALLFSRSLGSRQFGQDWSQSASHQPSPPGSVEERQVRVRHPKKHRRHGDRINEA